MAAACLCSLLSVVSVQAKTLPTDKDVAQNGCSFVGVEGSYIMQAKAALERINKIRKEACDEEVPNPDNPSKKLKPADYKPIRWSSDLEYIARIRAAEASVVMDHIRPNGEICFRLLAPNGRQSWGEVLAWNGSNRMTQGIEQWYGEKATWVKQSDGVTGHYTQMIDPENTYVGLATFINKETGRNTTSGEFTSEQNLDETMGKEEKNCIQTIEIQNSYKFVAKTHRLAYGMKATFL